MSTETAPAVVNAGRASARDAIKQNLREYGLVLALIAIMEFFQFTTNGILFLPVNLTNGAGDTLLILAAYHVHPVTVRALLDRGADTERVNDRGQTALAAAVFRQSADIVKMLLDAGADPSRGPRSALDVARFFDLPEMLALLERAAPH